MRRRGQVDEDGNPRRMRLWDNKQPPPRMRPVRSAIDLDPDAAESDVGPTEDELDASEEQSDSQTRTIPRRPDRVDVVRAAAFG